MSNTTLGKPHRSDPADVSSSIYDVVIVGAGVSGAIIANELSQTGFRVLILEAGPGHDLTIPGYEQYLSRFYASASKDNNAPYPRNRNAPMPRSTDVRRLQPGEPDASGYIVQNGPWRSTAPTPGSSAARPCTGKARLYACCPRISKCAPGSGAVWIGRFPTSSWRPITARPNSSWACRPTSRTRLIMESASIPATSIRCAGFRLPTWTRRSPEV